MHSSIVYLHKAGAKIHSVGDWFRLAPPQKGIKQWEDGRSAKELAKRWFSEKGKPQVPNELIELLNSTQKLKGTVIREGIPEHRIKLDNFRGNTRNTDLVLMGKKGNRRISISIEAKADEYFDLLVSEKLNSVKNKPDSQIPERIDILRQSLFGKSPDDLPILSKFRYQLLNGIAGSLIEAKNQNAHLALFVVHVFMSSMLNQGKVVESSRDFTKFIRLLTSNPDLIIDFGLLIGPIHVKGGPFVLSNIPLYVGKIYTDLDIS